MINTSEAVTYEAMLAATQDYSVSYCDFSQLLK
jgi:hypothetical protein